MQDNVMISNPEALEKIKKQFQLDGAEKLHVLADFDRTFTKAFVNGKKIPSMISVLRDQKYLTSDYPEQAQALFEHYHPIEIDPAIPIEQKKHAMHEWWSKHFELLITSHLQKKDLQNILASNVFELRVGVGKFIKLLHQHRIPLVLLSSSGLGEEMIAGVLKQQECLDDNVHIISNAFVWDKNGVAIRVRQPIIHQLNKDETALQDFPFYGTIEQRTNVVLMGDHVTDAMMVHGFPATHVLKVGFLNEKVEQDLAEYEQAFDMVICGDGTMDPVYSLAHEIV